VKEVPRPEPALLALDDDEALSGEHEKVLLRRFRVIEAARPAGLEDSEGHAEILEALLREVGARAQDRRVRFEDAAGAECVARQPGGVAHVHDEPSR
jgi:hypothetical protein